MIHIDDGAGGERERKTEMMSVILMRKNGGKIIVMAACVSPRTRKWPVPAYEGMVKDTIKSSIAQSQKVNILMGDFHYEEAKRELFEADGRNN